MTGSVTATSGAEERATVMEAVSYTAQWTAAARALESERPDAIFTDPWARALAGKKGFALLDRYAGAGTIPFIAVRTRFMDNAIVTTVAERDLRQVVLVAAGMDTRAGRLPWPDDTVLYELDHPELFAIKSQILQPNAYVPQCQRRTVPADLAGDWVPAVHAAGLDFGRPTLWVAEGLFFFLPADAVHGLLAVIRDLSGSGSVLIGDFVSAAALTHPLARAFLQVLTEDGNPWRFGTDDPESFLRDAGWCMLDLKQPGQDGADFGRWPYPVPPPAMTSAPRSFLFTAEPAPERLDSQRVD